MIEITLIEITSGAGMKMFRHGAAVAAIALLGSVLAIADAAAQAASPVGQCAFDKKDSFLYGRVTGVEGAGGNTTLVIAAAGGNSWHKGAGNVRLGPCPADFGKK